MYREARVHRSGGGSVPESTLTIKRKGKVRTYPSLCAYLNIIKHEAKEVKKVYRSVSNHEVLTDRYKVEMTNAVKNSPRRRRRRRLC